ncbi:prolipoprotein diacylglyceryl transferase, partial [Adlercreutzia sp. DFI.6.23]|uniref:prolipoprotein diacylglyceryl transferase n=1 Tax=Adlercreutzia sp. DFI.6.23 TaxID=2963705 RepID=UPI0021092356
MNDIYQGLDPIAFSLGPLVVRWYGLAYVLGFVCAAAIIYFVAKRWKLGMSEDNLLTLMVCAIVGLVLGARIGYVLFYGDGYYLSHPLEILAFNQGGMSFHGGLRNSRASSAPSTARTSAATPCSTRASATWNA